MIWSIPRRFALPVAAAVLLAVAAVLPRPAVPAGTSEVLDLAEASYSCPLWEGLDVLAGQVSAADEATAVVLPGGAAVPLLEDPTVWRSAAPEGEAIEVTQRGRRSGPVGFVAGVAAGLGEGLVAAACPQITDEAWFSGVGGAQDHDAQLVVVNPGTEEAVLGLSAWSTVGALELPDADAIVLAPGETRRIAASDLAAGEQSLSLRATRQRGTLVALMLTHGSGSVRGSDLSVGSAAPRRDLVTAGVPAEAQRRLMVTNPGRDTANLDVSVVSADGGEFVVEGLEDIAAEPEVVTEIAIPADVPAGSTLRIRSTQPIVGALRSQTSTDFADSLPLDPVRPGEAVVPILGDTRLSAIAPQAGATVHVEVFDAAMTSLGQQKVEVAGNSSVAIVPADIAEGGAYAVLRGEGGLWLAAHYASEAGVATLPVAVAPVDAVAPALSWGGRWH